MHIYSQNVISIVSVDINIKYIKNCIKTSYEIHKNKNLKYLMNQFSYAYF